VNEAPTLLLVHGGWSGVWIWEPLLGELRERGVRVEAIERLPSAGVDAGGLGDLGADAESVRARLADAAGAVVVCGHSYGGMVITEVADHPAISRSIYLAAFWPGKDQSLLDLAGDGPLPDWIVDRGDGSLAITDDRERARQALFADLDPDRAGWAHRQFVLQSAPAFAAPSSAPVRSHPVTYVLCTEDEAVPPAAQEAMSAPADEVVRMQSAHCPQLSHPEELADIIAAVVVEGHAGATAA
jgi:pimeloyl-ACP methyl ester carboxylesterase